MPKTQKVYPPIKVNLTLSISREDAVDLWKTITQEDEAPTGKHLAEWVADYAAETISSDWQYDANIIPNITIKSGA
ncbi:MAG: hypothetical protein EBS53_12665 [Bacteroidetes bacterium]|nr:hypothetical protein [Bacteroidota bacterium]